MDILEALLTPHDEKWHETADAALSGLFGGTGRFRGTNRQLVAIRAPKIRFEEAPFAALIHPSAASSGPYSGTSFVAFPGKQGDGALVGLVVGTQGLGEDGRLLSRPGHSRRANAIASWLNTLRSIPGITAWAKSDPTETAVDVPDDIRRRFPAFEEVFDRYGEVIYSFCHISTEDRQHAAVATRSYLDFYMSERRGINIGSATREFLDDRNAYSSLIMAEVSASEVAQALSDRRYVILEGPPGTGKTRLALELLAGSYTGRGQSIQFHPSTTYESFIAGLAPSTSGGSLGLTFRARAGALLEAIHQAEVVAPSPYLLHIDEINRADLAKVLGEAIFLLEAGTERPRSIGLSIELEAPFNRRVTMPPNLHILGTMNSSDRSTAILDVAIRRRFGFVQLWPQAKVVDALGSPLMREAFQRLFNMFIDYAADDELGLMPGHSYFLASDDAKAPTYLRQNVEPLLSAYLDEGRLLGMREPVRAYLQWIRTL